MRCQLLKVASLRYPPCNIIVTLFILFLLLLALFVLLALLLLA